MISKWFRMQEGLVIAVLLNFAAIAQTTGGSAGQGQAAPERVPLPGEPARHRVGHFEPANYPSW